MAKLKWPPEGRTFRYEFNDQLDMEIPAIDNEPNKTGKTKIEDVSRD